MKICAIVDEAADQLLIGYLYYYEKVDTFFIELSPEIKEIDAPVFLSSFIKRRILTIDPEWSARWVRQRIVPTDRQNLGMILRENGLKEYNAYRLLMLGSGRCAQDDCAVVPVKESHLPAWVSERKKRKLELAVALKEWKMFLVFQDGIVQKADLEKYLRQERRLQILLSRGELFQKVKLLPGGNGIYWGEGQFIMSEKLYGIGEILSIDRDEFRLILKSSILDTAQVCEELHCTRQYVNYLVQKGELACLKESGNNRIYERGEIEHLRNI